MSPDIIDTSHTMALMGAAFFVLGVPLFLGLAEASLVSALLVAASYLLLSLMAGLVFESSPQTDQAGAFAIVILPAYLILAIVAWSAGRVTKWIASRWRA